VVDENVERKKTRAAAEAYLKYVYTDEVQEVAAKHFYRPRNQAILNQHSRGQAVPRHGHCQRLCRRTPAIHRRRWCVRQHLQAKKLIPRRVWRTRRPLIRRLPGGLGPDKTRTASALFVRKVGVGDRLARYASTLGIAAALALGRFVSGYGRGVGGL
jgi:hypothetical protein